MSGEDVGMDLVTFLLARIAEDEAEARAAAAGPWTYGDIESVAGGSLYDPGVMIASIHWDNVGSSPEPIHRFRSEQQADATGRHIARWNPSRVLVDCEAKRRAVSYADTMMKLDRDPHGTRIFDAGQILRALALRYADHRDYRQEWRP